MADQSQPNEMDTNKTLGSAGAGQTITALGKVWTVLPPTRKTFAKMQSWLESEARRGVTEMKGKIDDDLYDDLVDRVLIQITTGTYAYPRKPFLKSLRSPEGGKQFLTVLMQQAHPQLTVDDVEKLVEDQPEQFKLVFATLLSGHGPKAKAQGEGGP